MEPAKWHRLSVAETARRLQTDSLRGLDDKLAKQRQRELGSNYQPVVLPTWREIVIGELTRPPLLLLVLSSGLIILLGRWPVGLFGLGLALVIIGLGVFGLLIFRRVIEWGVQARLTESTVLRSGVRRRLPPAELVPGDLLLFSAGDLVPVDARLTVSHQLVVWEGERALAKQVSASSQNLLWRGSAVMSGSGQALVVGSGFSAFAANAFTAPERERWLERSSVFNVWLFFGLGLVLLVTWRPALEPAVSFLSFLALVILALPASLAPLITFWLGRLGREFNRAGALIGKLEVVEKLARLDCLVIDQTSDRVNEELNVELIIPRSEIVGDREAVLSLALLSTEAWSDRPWSEQDKTSTIYGRPVERAMIRAGLVIKLSPERIFSRAPRVDFLPFNQERGYSASLHWDRSAKRHFAYFSGAPEILLARSVAFYYNGETQTMSESDREYFLSAIAAGEARGLSFLAAAFAPNAKSALAKNDPLGQNLIFGGLIGLSPGVSESREASGLSNLREVGLELVLMSAKTAAKTAAIESHLASKQTVALFSAAPLDLPLFAKTGFGLVPRVAPPALLWLADLVLPSNNNFTQLAQWLVRARQAFVRWRYLLIWLASFWGLLVVIFVLILLLA